MKYLKIQYFYYFWLIIIFLLPIKLRAESNLILPFKEIGNFVDVYNSIKKEYVDEKDGKTLINFAIKGMLDGLDPHSVYFKKQQLEDFQRDSQGSYLGFGISIEIIAGNLVIIAPIAGSPAEKAGLKPNDHIIKIDNIVIENMSMLEVDNLFKNKKEISLTIITSNNKSRKVKLKKHVINLTSVKAKIFDKKYGYIRISQFQKNTDRQFIKILNNQINKNVKGIILDLRNNPGGLLQSAINIANNFLDAGLIFSTKNYNNGNEEKVYANKNNTINKKIPLVILINEGSASASEMLTGALQDHKRALIVGQPSFGKGSVQNIITLNNGDAIKLTVARYYTPNGRSIQAKGIVPDIILNQLTVSDKNVNLLSYSENNIAGHLSADKKNIRKEKLAIKKVIMNNIARSDLQLFEALNILKTMIIMQ